MSLCGVGKFSLVSKTRVSDLLLKHLHEDHRTSIPKKYSAAPREQTSIQACHTLSSYDLQGNVYLTFILIGGLSDIFHYFERPDQHITQN